jgi:hypothetical protein
MFEIKRVSGRDDDGNTTYDVAESVDGTLGNAAIIARKLNFAPGSVPGSCCDVFERGEKVARVYRDGGIDRIR